ncbi:MAG: hypothetical protein FWG22_02515 [Prolixibacteraceae bacterium]|nr:hypothetical protein [Prolixibacteraceae bacterium]
MDTNFNHEQSLTLINEMILRAQNNVNKGKAYSFIILGYVLAASAMAIYVLLHTLSNPNQSFWVWLVMLPALVVMNFVERRVNGAKLVKTHIEKIGEMVWAGFGISCFVFIAVVFTIAFRLDTNAVFLLCTPVILTFVGMGQFITACVFRNKMWYSVAAVYWIGALACTFLNGDMHMIVFAVCMLLGYVVPGHILLHKAKKSHV